MTKIKSTKKVSRREVIREEAAKLFRAKGYSATSMRDLAGCVGVEAASLYNHIQSKSELLQDIIFKVANEYTLHIAQLESADIPSLQKIEQLIRFHIGMMLNNYEAVYVVNHDWKHLPEPYLTNFINQRRLYAKRFALIIDKGIERKEIRAIDSYVAVLTMLSAVRGIEFWQTSKKNISAEELENNMVLHLIGGLKDS
jgi:TetR/AcrR family transcriptional regulator, cholesterol catabolism regulator